MTQNCSLRTSPTTSHSRTYGDAPVHGRRAVVDVWAGVFTAFAEVRFETLSQAVNGDLVFAEQVHGLALPGGALAPIKNMAVYEIRDGQIAAWRDYTNPKSSPGAAQRCDLADAC